MKKLKKNTRHPSKNISRYATKQLFIMINFQLSARNQRLWWSYYNFVIYSWKLNLWAIFFYVFFRSLQQYKWCVCGLFADLFFFPLSLTYTLYVLSTNDTFEMPNICENDVRFFSFFRIYTYYLKEKENVETK